MDLECYNLQDQGLEGQELVDYLERMVEMANKDLAEGDARIQARFDRIVEIRSKNKASMLKNMSRMMQLKAECDVENGSLNGMIRKQDQLLGKFGELDIEEERHNREIEAFERKHQQTSEKYTPAGLQRMRADAEKILAEQQKEQKELEKKAADTAKRRREAEIKFEDTKKYFENTINDLNDKLSAAKRELLQKKLAVKMATFRDARRKN